jgi:hypothetical protein
VSPIVYYLLVWLGWVCPPAAPVVPADPAPPSIRVPETWGPTIVTPPPPKKRQPGRE